ncbi:MAG: VOC family protein [Clostridia bacterium]
MTFKLDHMCSVVRDMDTTIKFYTNVLGGQVVQYEIFDDEKCAFVQICEHLLKLVQPSKDVSAYGLSYLSFATDNLDEAHKYLVDLGYEFHVLPQKSPYKNGRNAFFKDPNGVIVELLEREREIHRDALFSPLVCNFDHYAIRCVDFKLAHKIYHEHIGFGNLAHFVIGENKREIMYLESGSSALEVVQGNGGASENPHAHLCFRVENIEETCTLLRERGIDLPSDIIKPAGIKTGLTVSFPDPEGTRIELVNRPDLRDFEKNGITMETLSTLRPF